MDYLKKYLSEVRNWLFWVNSDRKSVIFLYINFEYDV
ncbi:MAG: hypothetical protein KatS3mg035_0290 [Bacteroidia bacterium]|nr:MAG: hypothetical protein KatS3mg035_0290 [Bacteroidia bacterium]